MNRTPLWLRLTFGAVLLVPAVFAAYALVHHKPKPVYNSFQEWCRAQSHGCATESNGR